MVLPDCRLPVASCAFVLGVLPTLATACPDAGVKTDRFQTNQQMTSCSSNGAMRRPHPKPHSALEQAKNQIELPLAVRHSSHLQHEAHECHHCNAAVLNLLGLQLLQVALAEAQGVKDATGVAHLGVGHLVALEDGVLQGMSKPQTVPGQGQMQL